MFRRGSPAHVGRYLFLYSIVRVYLDFQGNLHIDVADCAAGPSHVIYIAQRYYVYLLIFVKECSHDTDANIVTC